MRIAICDHEQACVDKLCTLITDYCTGRRLTHDCQTFTDPLAFEESDLESYDMVFLDANMDEMDGIAAPNALREVIFSLVFLESFSHKILLHISDVMVLESKQYSLSELFDLLIPHSFIRIHKSYLVNPEYITTIRNRVVTLRGV